MKKPNLFEFATSELSQDAFLCYLLSYVKKEYENIYTNEYELGNKFFNVILKKCFKNEDIPKVETLEIKKQYNNIDILLILNETYYIIIEDKTETSEHSNQIQRYKSKLMEIIEGIEEEKIKTLYFKTGDESLHDLSASSKENHIMRKEFLQLYYGETGVGKEKEVLYKGNNCIISEYFERLKQIDDEVESFREVNLKEKEFSWYQMIGFYNALDREFHNCEKINNLYNEKRKIHSSWGYVANQNGGFLCYHFFGILECGDYSYYLQIEKINVKTKEEIEAEEKNEVKPSKNTRWTHEDVPYPSMTLVVKVWSENKNIEILRRSLEVFREKYKDKFDKKLFLKPNKFSSGTWMTQLLINDYIVLNENNTINVEKTVEKIREYQMMLKSLEKELKK